MRSRKPRSPAFTVYFTPCSPAQRAAASMNRCCGINVGSPSPRSIAPGFFFAAIMRISDGSIAATRGFTLDGNLELAQRGVERRLLVGGVAALADDQRARRAELTGGEAFGQHARDHDG